jgi:hypothetical protein
MNDDSQYLLSNFRKDDDSRYRLSNFKKKKKSDEDGILSSIGSGAKRFGKNIGIGISELGRNLANTPHNLANLIGQGDNVANLVDPEFDYAKAFGMDEEATLGDKLTRGLSQYGPAFALPGVGLGRAGAAIGSLGRGGKFLQGALEQAVPQAAFGATQDENPLRGAAEGGIGSVAGSALGAGLEKGFNALRPSKMFKSPLSKKELARSYGQAEGTNTDLGNIIQNPKLQRLYENVLPKHTGITSLNMQKTGQQIVKKGEDLMSKLLGKNSPDNAPEQLTNLLTKEFEKHQKMKNELYDNVDQLAEKHGLKLRLPSFAKEANKYKSAIEDTQLLKHEPEAKKILSKLYNYENPTTTTTTKGLLVDKQGKPLSETTKTEAPTLKEANLLKGMMGRYSKSYAKSPDADKRNMANIFKSLHRSLKKDISDEIDASGNEAIKTAYKKAEENYGKNFSPFLDRDVYKFVSGNADPETIVSKFITRSNSSDLAGKLAKLADKLKTQTKTQDSGSSNLLAYSYLSRAIDNEGNFNPAKFATSVKNLGPNQLKTLFPDKAIRKEVVNYKALVNKNPRSLQVMFNPLTGQVNSDLHPNALAHLIGGLAGLGTGGGVGAVVGAVGAPILKSKVAQFATKKLTDPEYRKEFVKALISGKDYELPKTAKKALEKGSAMTAGLSGKDKEQKPIELTLTKGRKR